MNSGTAKQLIDPAWSFGRVSLRTLRAPRPCGIPLRDHAAGLL
jgi:hypothetical protein